MENMSTTTKTGHDKKVTYFGMKVTITERETIHKLAKAKGKSAKKTIMELVHKDLENVGIRPKKRITAKELRALPLHEQERILEEDAKAIAKDYEVIEDGFDIVEDY